MVLRRLVTTELSFQKPKITTQSLFILMRVLVLNLLHQELVPQDLLHPPLEPLPLVLLLHLEPHHLVPLIFNNKVLSLFNIKDTFLLELQCNTHNQITTTNNHNNNKLLLDQLALRSHPTSELSSFSLPSLFSFSFLLLSLESSANNLEDNNHTCHNRHMTLSFNIELEASRTD